MVNERTCTETLLVDGALWDGLTKPAEGALLEAVARSKDADWARADPQTATPTVAMTTASSSAAGVREGTGDCLKPSKRAILNFNTPPVAPKAAAGTGRRRSSRELSARAYASGSPQ